MQFLEIGLHWKCTKNTVNTFPSYKFFSSDISVDEGHMCYYYKAILFLIKMKFLEIGVNIGNVQRNTENTIPLHKTVLQSNKKILT